MDRPARILIVDDVADIRELFRFSLELDGHSVTEASNGREALEEVRRSLPDLLVLDLTMPGMDGWAVLDELGRESGHRPKVAVVTAHADESVEIRARGAGADAYLAKPLDAADLRAAIR